MVVKARPLHAIFGVEIDGHLELRPRVLIRRPVKFQLLLQGSRAKREASSGRADRSASCLFVGPVLEVLCGMLGPMDANESAKNPCQVRAVLAVRRPACPCN